MGLDNKGTTRALIDRERLPACRRKELVDRNGPPCSVAMRPHPKELDPLILQRDYIWESSDESKKGQRRESFESIRCVLSLF